MNLSNSQKIPEMLTGYKKNGRYRWLPNAVGAIDSSHISIKAPHINHEDYYNWKQNYSINLQCVVDADGQVLQLSTLYRRAENDVILTEPVRHINGVCVQPLLIGNSPYPLHLGLLALVLILET